MKSIIGFRRTRDGSVMYLLVKEPRGSIIVKKVDVNANKIGHVHAFTFTDDASFADAQAKARDLVAERLAS